MYNLHKLLIIFEILSTIIYFLNNHIISHCGIIIYHSLGRLKKKKKRENPGYKNVYNRLTLTFMQITTNELM